MTIIATHNLDPRLLRRVKTFIKDGFDVSLLYGDRAKQNESMGFKGCNNITAVTFSNSGRTIERLNNLILFSKRVSDFLNKTKPEIIYVSGFDALISMYASGWLEKKVLIYEVADLPGGRWRKTSFFRQTIDFIERKMLKHVNKIILTSPYFIDCNYKKYKSKVFVFKNLPEKRLFGNHKKDRHKNFVIGFLGLIRYKRPMETLIKGLGGLEGIEIIIAGTGQHYNEIEIMAKQYDNVKMLGPYNYEEDIINLYSAIDCVYSVYDTDSDNVKVALPNKLYEAIVCGLPLLASKGTRLGEYVEKNGLGFAVSPYDPDELKKTVLNLAGDRKIIEEINDRCNAMRNKYFYEYAEEDFIKQIKQLLKGDKDNVNSCGPNFK